MGKKQQRQPGSYAEAAAESVRALYVDQGMPISQVTRLLGLRYPTIRQLLEKLGVPVRGRGAYTQKGAAHPSSKLSEELRQKLESELRLGHPHSQLATQYGLSRERVRQIATRIEAPTGRQLQTSRRQARDEKKVEDQGLREQAKIERHDRHYAEWRRLWAAGVSIRGLAEALQLKQGSVSVRIVQLRKTHPSWFPKRRHSKE